MKRKGKHTTTYEEERLFQRQELRLFFDKSSGMDASKQGRNDDKTEELNLTNEDDTEVIVEDKGSGEKDGSTADQVSTARPEVSVAAPSTPPTTTAVFNDEDLTYSSIVYIYNNTKANSTKCP
ncbi:hypothetical protein Tco_0157542 [Tanacetum coccineum]